MARLKSTKMDRFLYTVTDRFDGSSRLAEGKKYANFPSVAFGWRVIDEAFGRSLGPINSLKLRTSYGRTGTTSVNPYHTQVALSRSIYAFASTSAVGVRPAVQPNPNL